MAYTTIDDPSVHFHTQLYTGTGSLNSVTNDANAGDFKPDWIQIKNRSQGWSNIVFDSSRGTNKALYTPATDGDVTSNARGYLSAFNTDGFTVGAGSSGSDNVNTNGNNYVAWQWKANGGTTSSNGTGTLTTTNQINSTAKFSIITYNGGGSGGTLGHGLGTVPHLIIIKSRAGRDWCIYHHKNTTAPETDFLSFNQNVATQDATVWNDQAPTSTIISVSGDGKVGTNEDYVGYVFSEVQGFSKFDSYVGNNSTDGPFVYTGFKPAYVWIKRTDSTGNWYIYDTERNGSSGPNTNQAHKIVYLNDSSSEVDNTSRGIDMNANGFKVRNTLGDTNADGGTYIYAAFASSPFVSSAGVPTTAR